MALVATGTRTGTNCRLGMGGSGPTLNVSVTALSTLMPSLARRRTMSAAVAIILERRNTASSYRCGSALTLAYDALSSVSCGSRRASLSCAISFSASSALLRHSFLAWRASSSSACAASRAACSSARSCSPSSSVVCAVLMSDASLPASLKLRSDTATFFCCAHNATLALRSPSWYCFSLSAVVRSSSSRSLSRTTPSASSTALATLASCSRSLSRPCARRWASARNDAIACSTKRSCSRSDSAICCLADAVCTATACSSSDLRRLSSAVLNDTSSSLSARSAVSHSPCLRASSAFSCSSRTRSSAKFSAMAAMLRCTCAFWATTTPCSCSSASSRRRSSAISSVSLASFSCSTSSSAKYGRPSALILSSNDASDLSTRSLSSLM
eukprot:Unigene3729_Nuclearia_a/m.11383 Unigene3729_Nuclearia_a/g.11383  ORF Unigene3729_Nuclearia_a/g.11383 Unigene3729_Nuclearia_a/m.11383 type:complete len:385 (+) Unigene3729_Nuclearia_a:708-1862(+)